MRCVLLPPMYLPVAGYYAAMARYDVAVIDVSMRHDRRRKAVHRTVIAGNAGPLMLTVPVSHTQGAKQWDQIAVADHGRWADEHRGALASAYGRTPFYEYYAPQFDALITDDAVGLPVTQFDCRLDALIRQLLGITTRVSAVLPPGIDPTTVTDLRRSDFSQYAPPAYRQLRADRLGYIPNLSIVDALFNLGPDQTRQLLT